MQITYRIGLAVQTISFAAMLGRRDSDGNAIATLNQVDFGKVTTVCAVHVRPGMATTYSLAGTKGFWPEWSVTPTVGGRRVLVNRARVAPIRSAGIVQIPSTGNSLDERPSIPCKLYVGGFSYDISDAFLLAYFSQVGRVVEAIVVNDKMMGNRSKGFGYVTFAEDEPVVRAVQRFHDELMFQEDSYDFTDVSDEEGAAGLGHFAVLRIVENASKSFAKLVCQDFAQLRSLEWRDVERMLGSVFSALGYSVQLTPGAKDGGKDIVLGFVVSGKSHSYYVEVKHWSGKKVGGRIVKQFLSVVARDQQDGGILLATSGFSSTAIEAVTEFEADFRFGNDKSIVMLCRTYLAVGQGLLVPPEPLKLLHNATIASAQANEASESTLSK